MNLLRILIFLLLVLPMFAHAEGGGSGAGNGGDILSAYLESTRRALQRVITLLGTEERAIGRVCGSLSLASENQKEACSEYLKSSLPEWASLSASVELRVVSENLDVTRSDGSLRRVDARTALGPQGRIEFDFERIHYYSPKQMLQLVVHELGHKIEWDGTPIEDEKPTHGFESGKNFLDELGLSVARFAEKERLIGRSFQLYDIFDCTVQLGEKIPYLITMEEVSPRIFSTPDQFGRYEVGVGARGAETKVEITERTSGSKLSFRFNAHETNACSDLGRAESRWTEVELVRTSKSVEETLFKKTFQGINPVCSPGISPIRVSYQDFVFECAYVGSSGVNQSSEPESGDEK